MFNLKRLFSFVLFLSLVFSAHVSKVESAGFPVIDIASIVQTIKGYMQQLQDMQEQIKQVQTLDDQYRQMLADYTQQLKEYQNYLDELRGLANFISPANWNTILQQTVMDYGQGSFSTIPALSPSSQTFNSDIDAVISQTYYKPRPAAVVVNDMKNLGMVNTTELDAEARLIEGSFSRLRDAQVVASSNEDNSNKRRVKISTLAGDLRSLPDGSSFALMQLMASQNQMFLDQNEAMIGEMNQLLQQQGNLEAMIVSKKAKRVDDEITRLRTATQTRSPGLGQSRWGNL